MLDNFEQVVDAGPIVVEPLLRGARGAKALVTSRVPLHLYGEREYAGPTVRRPRPGSPPRPGGAPPA